MTGHQQYIDREIDKLEAEVAKTTLRIQRQLVVLKRQRNTMAAISSLPPEVLFIIFLEFVSGPLWARKRLKGQLPDQLILCHVCSAWKATALACADLWTCIRIEGPDRWPWIDYMLEGSQKRHLSLDLNLSDDKPLGSGSAHQVMQMIASRLEVFSVTAPGEIMQNVFKDSVGSVYKL